MGDPYGSTVLPDIGILEGDVISLTLGSKSPIGEINESLFEFKFVDLNNVNLVVTYDLQGLKFICEGTLIRL